MACENHDHAKRVLPQLSSCGPIEAFNPAAPTGKHVRLPQLSSCGPIEATRTARSATLSLKAFRNYQVAAPLKRPDDSKVAPGGRAFRNYQVAAPLKRPIVLSYSVRWGAFRNYQVAAPLKHAGEQEQNARQKPSATIKLRPH